MNDYIIKSATALTIREDHTPWVEYHGSFYCRIRTELTPASELIIATGNEPYYLGKDAWGLDVNVGIFA